MLMPHMVAAEVDHLLTTGFGIRVKADRAGRHTTYVYPYHSRLAAGVQPLTDPGAALIGRDLERQSDGSRSATQHRPARMPARTAPVLSSPAVHSPFHTSTASNPGTGT